MAQKWKSQRGKRRTVRVSGGKEEERNRWKVRRKGKRNVSLGKRVVESTRQGGKKKKRTTTDDNFTSAKRWLCTNVRTYVRSPCVIIKMKSFELDPVVGRSLCSIWTRCFSRMRVRATSRFVDKINKRRREERGPGRSCETTCTFREDHLWDRRETPAILNPRRAKFRRTCLRVVFPRSSLFFFFYSRCIITFFLQNPRHCAITFLRYIIYFSSNDIVQLHFFLLFFFTINHCTIGSIVSYLCDCIIYFRIELTAW